MLLQLSTSLGSKDMGGYRGLEDVTTDAAIIQKDNLLKSTVENGGSAGSNKNEPNFQVTGQIRTATGGFIQKVMIFFTIVAFVGNAVFMVNVFFMSR